MKNKNYIQIAKKAASLQIKELKKVNKVFNKEFLDAVNLIANCKGKVIAAGLVKSGLIARKISATLSSVGISSFYLNPGEANHGDLGQIDKRDILLVFSYSGNTAEIVNMLKYANRFNIKVIGIASKPDSILIFDTIRPEYFNDIFKKVEVIKKDFDTVHKSKRIVCTNF